MNAVMPPLCPSLRGTLARTTMMSAMVPLVVHSLRPVMRYPEPSSVGTAAHVILAGSEPTPGSVSANADSCVHSFGSQYSFCSSEPKYSTGWGAPIDWCADSSTPRLQCQVPTSISARL